MMKKFSKGFTAAVSAVMITVLSAAMAVTVYAAEKPEIAAQGAALYNATTGEFLYGKNENQQFFPASITKVMTALLVVENCGLDETVVFTDSATKNLESGAVSLDVTAGDQIPVRDCLYGLLLKSANEVANGLAEHVAGSVPAFAQKMNEKARSLGCTATNFVNPNGLNNASHLTTPHDMALITAACFQNAAFREIEKSTSYHFPATINRPDGTNITMGHKMISPANSQHYPGILGGKTGYTSKAGNTLVTCVERDGVRLVVAVMKCAGTHYTDTRKLLDYGFALAEESGLTRSASAGNTALQSAAQQETAAAAASEDQDSSSGPGVSTTAAAQQTAGGSAAVVKPAAETTAAPAAETAAAETTAAPAAAETSAAPASSSSDTKAVIGEAPGGDTN